MPWVLSGCVDRSLSHAAGIRGPVWNSAVVASEKSLYGNVSEIYSQAIVSRNKLETTTHRPCSHGLCPLVSLQLWENSDCIGASSCRRHGANGFAVFGGRVGRAASFARMLVFAEAIADRRLEPRSAWRIRLRWPPLPFPYHYLLRRTQCALPCPLGFSLIF